MLGYRLLICPFISNFVEHWPFKIQRVRVGNTYHIIRCTPAHIASEFRVRSRCSFKDRSPEKLKVIG